MVGFLFVIVAFLLCREAILEYFAEKYANQKVHNKKTSFLYWMALHHPYCLIIIGGSILLFIALLFV